MRGLDTNTNICRHDSSCDSGQASCHDRVELRLSESCKEWSDQQWCFSLEKWKWKSADIPCRWLTKCWHNSERLFGSSRTTYPSARKRCVTTLTTPGLVEDRPSLYLSNENIASSRERLGSRGSHGNLHEPANLGDNQRHHTQVVKNRDKRTEEDNDRENLEETWKAINEHWTILCATSHAILLHHELHVTQTRFGNLSKDCVTRPKSVCKFYCPQRVGQRCNTFFSLFTVLNGVATPV